MKLLTVNSTPAEFVEAVNGLLQSSRARDPLAPYHRLLSWLETVPLQALVACDTPLPSPKGDLLGRWRPLRWSMSLGFGQISVCASDTDPAGLQGSRLDCVLFLTTPTPALLAAIEERLLGARDPVVEWGPGVERPEPSGVELPADVRALYGDAFVSARRDADPNRWTIWYLTSAGRVASWTVGDGALRTVPNDILVRTSEEEAARAGVALRGPAPAADAMVGEGHPLYARTTCWRDGVEVPYRAVDLATGVSVLDGVETWVDTVRIDDSAGPPARQFLPHSLPAFVHIQGGGAPTGESS